MRLLLLLNGSREGYAGGAGEARCRVLTRGYLEMWIYTRYGKSPRRPQQKRPHPDEGPLRD